MDHLIIASVFFVRFFSSVSPIQILEPQYHLSFLKFLSFALQLYLFSRKISLNSAYVTVSMLPFLGFTHNTLFSNFSFFISLLYNIDTLACHLTVNINLVVFVVLLFSVFCILFCLPEDSFLRLLYLTCNSPFNSKEAFYFWVISLY